MKKFFSVLIAFVLIVSMTHKSNIKADANVHLNITSVRVTNDHDVVYPTGSNINQYDNLVVKINFTIPNGTVTEGAQSVITISDDLRLPTLDPFTVYDPSGTHAIAQATVDEVNKTITLVYTDYAVGKQNVAGHIQFFSRVDFDVATTNRIVDVSYSLNGTVIADLDLSYTRRNDDEDEIMSKYQWFEGGIVDKYTSIIRVNPSEGTYTDVTINDELRTTGTQYDRNSFVIKKGIWRIGNSGVWTLQNGVDVTNQFIPDFRDLDTKFSIDFGAMGPTDQYRIEYRVKTNRIPVSGELFSNYVEMVDSTVVVEHSLVNTAYAGGGGSADGTVTVSGEKTWVDGDNQDGLRPSSINVNLLADGEIIRTLPVSKDGDGKWLFSFSDLPFLKNGIRIVYSVSEDAVNGYTLSYAGFNITNTHTPATTSVSGTKTWVDANDQDGLRPTSIVVNLLADGVKVNSATVSEAQDGTWTYNFSNLPMYEDGEVIVYTITEEPVAGYTTSYAGFNITNTHTPATTTVAGTKTWVDANDQDGLRPTSIVVNLLADGVKVNSATVSEAQDGTWTFNFSNLPMYKDGVLIVYTITEELVTGYTPSYDGFDITNTHVPGTISITGTKTWIDANNQDGIRPSNLTLTLFANGLEVQNVIPTWAKNGNVWTYVYSNLPVNDAGSMITYTVSEESVAGYNATQNGLNFTNTQLPKGEVENLPDTGVARNYLGNFMIIAGISLLLGSYIKKSRRA